jgi:hypothetical protein
MNDPENSQQTIEQAHDVVDWDSDQSGVLAGRIHYRDRNMSIEHDLDDKPECHIHVQRNGDILVTVADNSEEAVRDLSMWLNSDAARQIAEQLQFAADYSDNNDGGADVRT